MRPLKILLCLVLLWSASPAWAKPADLPTLAAQLAKVRATHGVNQLRDAGPELNDVKHTLRTWVEQQLPAIPGPAGPYGITYSLDSDDLTDLSVHLSQALDKAGLTCGRLGSPDSRCGGNARDFESERGYVDRVRLAFFDGDRYLMIVTGVGVRCGFDQSAYIYAQGADRHWHRLMTIEQDRYGDHEYRVENFVSIDVASPQEAKTHAPLLVAAIGYSPWCSSNWNMLHTRLWRATPAPKTLLDRDDELYTATDLVAGAQLTDHDLLVQFDGKSVDGGQLIRTHVLHYAIDSTDRLRRIAPLALNPSDFIEEWLTSPWPEAMQWLDRKAGAHGLDQVHARLYTSDLFGDLDPPMKRCRGDAGLWQVSFAADPGGKGADGPPDYFQVRWRAPYDFTLIAVSSHPFAGCDKDGKLAPGATLFPLQGWR